MRVLLTNDDGIDAIGISALAKAIPDGIEIFQVAPLRPMSECGHRVTTGEPLEIVRREDSVFAVDGTPADCVRVALTHLMASPPDLILSGINSGGNLGPDVFISGTVAAVREGVFHGVPGLAFSHHLRDGRRLDWDWAGRCARVVMEEWRQSERNVEEYWNVNLPHLETMNDTVPERVRCLPTRHSLPVAYREVEGEKGKVIYSGKYNSRQGEPGSDVAVCFEGKISVSLFSRYSVTS